MVDLDKLIFWARLLGIPQDLLWFSLPNQPGPRAETVVHTGEVLENVKLAPPEAAVGFDDPDVIRKRRRHAIESNVDEARLRYFEDVVREVIDENERCSPRQLVPRVRALRARVEDLLDGRQPPDQRERLYCVAAQLSGVLGVLALDLGYFTHAAYYGSEAFALAETVRVPNLQAWVRAGQSLIAYYAGQYHDALAYARDGLERAPRGPQTVRLTLNGEARALARLGDVHGVDAAVARGLASLDEQLDGTEQRTDKVSPSLALDPYCEARAAANAATAYLLVDRPNHVIVQAKRALTAFDRAELRGPQALSRLDLATAELQRPNTDIDLEYACSLAADALTLTTHQGYESVNQRAAEFLSGAQRWKRQADVQRVAGLLSQRSQRSLPPIPSKA